MKLFKRFNVLFIKLVLVSVEFSKIKDVRFQELVGYIVYFNSKDQPSEKGLKKKLSHVLKTFSLKRVYLTNCLTEKKITNYILEY